MLASEHYANLLRLLNFHFDDFSTIAQNYICQLEQTKDEEIAVVYVFKIFHHIATRITSLEENNKIKDGLKVCVGCLHCLNNTLKLPSHIPENGVEKVVYQILNCANSFALSIFIDEVLDILQVFLCFIKKQPKNKEVLRHISVKIRNLNLDDKCECHSQQCFLIKLFQCKIYGAILDVVKSFTDELISPTSYFIGIKNVSLSLVDMKTNCFCHNQRFCEIIRSSTAHFFSHSSSQESNFITSSIELIADFILLCSFLECDQVFCPSPCKNGFIEILKRFSNHIKIIEISLRGLSTSEQSMTCEVITKIFAELVRYVGKYFSQQNLLLDWKEILITFQDLCQKIELWNKEIFVMEVMRNIMYLCNKVIYSAECNNIKGLVLSQANNLLLKYNLLEYDEGKLSLLVDCAINVCFGIGSCDEPNVLREAATLTKNITELLLKKNFDKKKQFQNSCILLCKLLRKLNRSQEAMSWIGGTISNSTLDQEKLKLLVTQWLRCKQSLVGSDVGCQTIADDLKSADTLVLINSLKMQHGLCRASKHLPPADEFYVLSKLVETCDKESSDFLEYATLLTVFLQSWKEVYVYKNRDSLLNFLSHEFQSDVSVTWEIPSLFNFAHYLYSYENTLAKVWKSKEKNNEIFENPSMTARLTWFPDVAHPDRTCLVAMVNALAKSSNSESMSQTYMEEIIQAYRVLIVLLRLYGEDMLLLSTLRRLEKIVQSHIEREENQAHIIHHLVMIKCSLSRLYGDFAQLQESLTQAQEAESLCTEAEKDSLKDGDARSFNYANIMAKLSLVKALILNGKFAKASDIMSDVTNNDFISQENKKSSRMSCYAGAQVTSISSELSIALAEQTSRDSGHPLHAALTTVTTLSALLDQYCPGLCRILHCGDFSNSQQWNVRFGKKTKELSYDVVIQFELIEHLIGNLHRVANLWLMAGDPRFALFYACDGIMLCRALCLPEKELSFQLLLTKRAIMHRNVVAIKEELNVSRDVLKFIGKMEEKEETHRSKLFSDFSLNGNKKAEAEVEQAINNSSVMEEVDEDDAVSIATVDVDIDVVAPVNDRNVMASPKMKKRFKKQMHFKRDFVAFAHSAKCDCRLCSNISLVKSQCFLVQLYAEYMKISSTVAEAICHLENARTYLSTFFKNRNLVFQDFQPNNKPDSCCCYNVFYAQELSILSSFAQIYLHSGELKSSKMYTSMGLMMLPSLPVTYELIQTRAALHVTAGQLLLAQPLASEISISQYIDVLIDAMNQCQLSPSRPDSSIDTKEEKLTRGMNKIPTDPAISAKKSTKLKVGFKTPRKTAQSKRLTSFQTPSRSSRKLLIENQNINFKIFEEEDDVDINLSTKKPQIDKVKNKLPIPDIFEDGEPPTLPTKKKINRKVTFNFSSDESDDSTNSSAKAVESKTPAPSARRSSRIAAKNVMSTRREARRRHRQEEGPIYTEEELEVVRAPRKSTRPTRKISAKSTSTSAKRKASATEATNARTEEPEEIECLRDSNPADLIHPATSIETSDVVDCEAGNADFGIESLPCDKHFYASFNMATSALNFHLMKRSLQHLSIHHCGMKNILLASAYHSRSIGVSYDISSHVNWKMCLRLFERAKRKDPGRKIGCWETDYLRIVRDMVEWSHPSHVMSLMHDPNRYLTNLTSMLPSDWSICLLSHVNEGKCNKFLVTRLNRDFPPLHLQLKGEPVDQLSQSFADLLECNIKALKATDKSIWWTQRRNENRAMDDFIKVLDAKTLGCHRGVLVGLQTTEECKSELARCVGHVTEVMASYTSSINRCLVEIFLQSWKSFSVEERTHSILILLDDAGISPTSKIVSELVVSFNKYLEHFQKNHVCKRGHVVLVLDKEVQAFPWESVPTLRGHSVSRMPSLDAILWQLRLSESSAHAKVDLRKVAYVINPKGDLMKTENRFADWFTSIQSWDGILSRVPSRDRWTSFLTDYDAFIFCGHGSGSGFMHQEVIARRRTRACALLMGCSSGKMAEDGIFEPSGMSSAYLVSGSPCVLACLWPVTDKDIDRYLAKCLIEWMKPGTYLTDVIRKAEVACKIPRLNGSACVVYGLPVQSTKAVSGWFDSLPEHFSNLVS